MMLKQENVAEYYEACKRQFDAIEADYRAHHVKVLSILAFGVALFTAAMTLSGNVVNSVIESWTYGIMSTALAGMIGIGLSVIVPRKWKNEYTLDDIRNLLNETHEKLILAMADSVNKAIAYNRDNNVRQANKIIWLIRLTALEASAFIAPYVWNFFL